MEKELRIEAATIELARKKLRKEIPEGFFPISANETPPEKIHKTHTGQSEDEALKNASPDLKKYQAEILQSSPPKQRTFLSYAPNEEEAGRQQNICNSNYGLKLNLGYQVNSVKLIRKGDRVSFFSLKRNYHQYEVNITELPWVEICYSTKALIEANITDDLVYANVKLLYYSKIGNHFLVKSLIDCGADIDAADEEGKNALFHATENGHIDLALFLINKGIDVFKKDNDGNEVLSIENAGTWNDMLVSRLVEKGLKKPAFLFRDYCPNCKQRTERYEEDLYDYDDGWFTRVDIKCAACNTSLREKTRQN